MMVGNYSTWKDPERNMRQIHRLLFISVLGISLLKPFSRNSAESRRLRHFRPIFHDNLWLEVVTDVISDVDVEYVGMDVPVKFGDSRSIRSQDIRATHFVMDRRRLRTQVITQIKTPYGILPKNQVYCWRCRLTVVTWWKRRTGAASTRCRETSRTWRKPGTYTIMSSEESPNNFRRFKKMHFSFLTNIASRCTPIGVHLANWEVVVSLISASYLLLAIFSNIMVMADEALK